MLVKMKDICTKIGSGATPKGGNNAYIEEGTALIRSQNILDFSFSYNGLAYINDEQASKLNGVTIKEDDVLLNITGDSVARACMVDNSVLPARVNQHVCIVRGNKSRVLSSFILYFLQMKKPELLMMASSGATRNALTKGMIEELEVELPSLEKQERMVSLLDNLQNKISKNNQINRNLSEQAKALFEEELLKFDSVPEGWKKGSLSDIADYLNGLAMQKFRPGDDEKGLPVLKIKELRQGSCDANSELCSLNIKPEYIIHDGDVIFSWSGSLLVDFWCGGECGLNQHLFKVTSKKYDKWFYYAWTLYHLDRFIAVAADKATTMGHIKREELSKAEVLIPDSDSYKRIGEVLGPLYDMIISNRVENRRLATLRDELLPMLMSGKKDVSEVEL